jgi:antitoxin (DNA-binding transcriptional repressor) of toxin-antitoxin stability system
MKQIELKQASLADCVQAAQEDRILLLREGKPVALLVGVEQMDQEQIESSQDASFWQLIQERRQQPMLSREDLEKQLLK